MPTIVITSETSVISSTPLPAVETAISVGALSNTANRQIFEVQEAPAPRRQQIVITSFLILANLVQMISNIVSIAGGLAISEALGLQAGPGKANWVAASLTQGTFVLASGRLGEVYSHRRILLYGVAWLAICSLVNGVFDNFVAFNIVRALSGIGGALIMPNAVAMIGIFALQSPTARTDAKSLIGFLWRIGTNRRQPWKCLCGFSDPVSPLALDFLHVSDPVHRGFHSPHIHSPTRDTTPAVGWQNPSEAALLVTSIVILCAFGLWEWEIAKEPIMPLGIWKAPSFLPLVIVVLFSFMSFGTLLWYMIAWQMTVRGWSVTHFALGWVPFGIFGTIGAGLAGWLIPRLAPQWILALGLGTVGVSNLLLATMPDQQTYCSAPAPTRQPFISLQHTIVTDIDASTSIPVGPDLSRDDTHGILSGSTAQIIASNAVRRSQQGTAASLVGLLNLYGNSLGLGFAGVGLLGTVESEVNKTATDVTLGYRAALYFRAGLAGMALLFDVFSVRMKRDVREGWDEDE
ncbi:related to aminotriazole resistance protein [Phialocephala subalpina]|uniref:Related to aminotriazole resistance protein n=1 Tax=Phialocephala subalpina TaxID=576137 RepID=A0A1L7X1K9_9HELO|nr:related to aminotriazole resistance protein [Phialocephala subalpina]